MTTGNYRAPEHSEFVDVYWVADDGGLTLLVGYILAKHLKKKLRVFSVAYITNGDNRKFAQERMERLCERFRIKAEVHGIEIHEN